MILDTYGLLGLVGGSKRLSASCLRAIREAPAVYVPAISGFEIAHKAAKGKLELPKTPREWFTQAVQHFGIEVLPLELETCIMAADLPRIHDDPYDRFIVATAKLHGLTVVTADENFGKYGVTVLS